MHDAIRLIVDFMTGGDPAINSGASAEVYALARLLSFARDILLTLVA